jgi:hypothetical protein
MCKKPSLPVFSGDDLPAPLNRNLYGDLVYYLPEDRMHSNAGKSGLKEAIS